MKRRIPTIDQYLNESFFKNLNVGEEPKTKAWLDSMKIKNYTINKDGTVDVKGNVLLSYKNLTEIPVQFNKVSGNFWCEGNKLKSLKGCPRYVGNTFFCFENNLTTLEGAPKEVFADFSCSRNKLISLEGAPQKLRRYFYCSGNNLTSLKLPLHLGHFSLFFLITPVISLILKISGFSIPLSSKN